ncbi:MAG: tetratricopeptide repeat protein [bacterium]|nr:tetratricopeptide repeat protein [bacterium]
MSSEKTLLILDGMEPLFAAVAHGCRAGLHHEVKYDVFWDRIKRGNEHYNTRKLGAFGAHLSALSHFFEVPWSRPASGLLDRDKAFILSWSAFGLRAVGRLREASQAMKATLERYEKMQDSKEMAIAANNLSELLLTLGEVSEAADYARRSVTHTDRSGDDFQREVGRTTLADALHQAGQCAEAEKWFREAEDMQKKRAWMNRAGGQNSADFRRAMDHLDRAVTGLREAGTQDHLPRGLLVRAEWYCRQTQFTRAWQDLTEAKEIADAGEMKLHQTDFHLLAATVCEAEGKKTDAREHRRKAGKLIEETGYKRREKINC